jgi:hypothetical protein
MSGRFFVAMPLCFGMLSTASGDIMRPCSAAAPSRFDYLVLASIADSQRPIWMASYRPTGGAHDQVDAHDLPGARDPLEVAVQLE